MEKLKVQFYKKGGYGSWLNHSIVEGEAAAEALKAKLEADGMTVRIVPDLSGKPSERIPGLNF